MPPATTSSQAQSNLQSFGNSMLSPQDAVQQANNQFQVGQQQQQVQGLRQSVQNTTNLLNQVAPSVMGRTQNSLVTDAQANRQIANEQAPLNTQLNTEGQQYSNANSDYLNSEGQAANMANSMLTGQQNKLSYLQGVYNDLYTQEQNAAQLQAQKDAARAASSGGASPSFGGLGASGVGTASGGGGPSQQQFMTDLQHYLPSNYATQFPAGYTERTAIPKMQALYPELDKNQVANMVYQYRKQYEGGGSNTSFNPLSMLNSLFSHI